MLNYHKILKTKWKNIIVKLLSGLLTKCYQLLKLERQRQVINNINLKSICFIQYYK